MDERWGSRPTRARSRTGKNQVLGYGHAGLVGQPGQLGERSCPHLLLQLDPGQAGHPHVQHQAARAGVGLARGIPRGERLDRVAGRRQQPSLALPDGGAVIHDKAEQRDRRHYSPSGFCASWARPGGHGRSAVSAAHVHLRVDDVHGPAPFRPSRSRCTRAPRRCGPAPRARGRRRPCPRTPAPPCPPRRAGRSGPTSPWARRR
jgi:hypothetical protein